MGDDALQDNGGCVGLVARPTKRVAKWGGAHLISNPLDMLHKVGYTVRLF